jgi:hypothetical protein
MVTTEGYSPGQRLLSVSETQNHKPDPCNQKHGTSNPKRDHRPSIIASQPSSIDTKNEIKP